MLERVIQLPSFSQGPFPLLLSTIVSQGSLCQSFNLASQRGEREGFSDPDQPGTLAWPAQLGEQRAECLPWLPHGKFS